MNLVPCRTLRTLALQVAHVATRRISEDVRMTLKVYIAIDGGGGRGEGGGEGCEGEGELT